MTEPKKICLRCGGKGVVVIKPFGALFVKKKCPMCKGKKVNG